MISLHRSIGFRLFVISLIVLALPLLVDSFILVFKRYKHNIEDAKDLLIEANRIRALPFSQIRPVTKPLIETYIHYLKLDQSFPQMANEQLNLNLLKLAKIGDFDEVSILKITEEGRYIVVASGNKKLIGKDETEFLKLFDLYRPSFLERGFASYITYDSKTSKPYFVIAHVIFSENVPIGVLMISKEVGEELKELLKPDTRRLEIDFALLAPPAIVIAASDPNLVFHYFESLSEEQRQLFENAVPLAIGRIPKEPIPVVYGIGANFWDFTWNGEEKIGHIKLLENSKFSILAYASKKRLFNTPITTIFNIFISYVIILFLGGLLAYLLTWRMEKPVQRLGNVMKGIQKGNLQQRYQQDPLGFEVNALGKVFNEMVDSVLDHQREAEEERVSKEILEKELKLGQQVQRSLLPQSMPNYPGVQIAEIYIPAIEVGGDFYDVFIRKHNSGSQLVLVVADASGKGVQACFYSLGLRNILRTFVSEYENIGTAVTASNQLFMRDTQDSGMFVTAIIGVYESKTGLLSYFSCGHNPGLVRRENGSVELLEKRAAALGVMPLENAQAHSIHLQEGDTLIFYTDGITEAHNEDFELFGDERLMDCLKNEGWRGADDVVNKIIEAVNAFVGKAPQHDDITLLVMKVKSRHD